MSEGSSSSSPEEKKRIPPQLSVSHADDFVTKTIFTMCVIVLLCRRLWLWFMMPTMKTNSSGQIWGRLVHCSVGILTHHICAWILLFCRSRDEHNKKVKRLIAEEVNLSKENVHSKTLVESKFNIQHILQVVWILYPYKCAHGSWCLLWFHQHILCPSLAYMYCKPH